MPEPKHALLIAEADHHRTAITAHTGEPSAERCGKHTSATAFSLTAIAELAKTQIDPEALATTIAAKLKPSTNGKINSEFYNTLPPPVRIFVRLWTWFKNGKDAIQPFVWMIVLYVGANSAGCIQNKGQRDAETTKARVALMQRYLTYMLGPPPPGLLPTPGDPHTGELP